MRVQPPVHPEPRTRTLAGSPSLVPLLARGALLSPFKRPRPDAPVPATRLVLSGVRVDLAHLAAYERVCGFPTGADALPVTYPHVLAFPLAMRILAGRAFPLPLLGLVHTSIEISGRQECATSAEYELAVLVEKLTPHRRGTEATVLTEARVHGRLVWESRSTYLARHRPRNGDKNHDRDHERDGDGDGDRKRDRDRGGDRDRNRNRNRHQDRDRDRNHDRDGDRKRDQDRDGDRDRHQHQHQHQHRDGNRDRKHDRGQEHDRGLGHREGPGRPRGSEPLPALAEWHLAPDVGRRYGAVSGDRNPIHLHPLTARLFGFPRAIAHGMWTVARCLAEYGPGQVVEVRAEFRAPVLLPGAVTYAARGSSFELRSGERLHLTGDVRPPRA
ncbi:MaoC/PaaZ C-terminal domain-containing protein [Streptomyces sp. NPDC048404]|uniref:MaoC/PaaZ C-terminal domain-containing protein n=1 Tax=unclassified Streptomyces TaxID=2593676 RepID=UPI0034300B47